MISILDYGTGNIRAIKNILDSLNKPVQVVSSVGELEKSSKIILPGVGAFDNSMNKLRESGMLNELNRQVLQLKTPILGICVGMQIMAKNSEEGSISGLNWIPNSRVEKVNTKKLKTKPLLPHMGWNLANTRKYHDFFINIDHKKGFYFLHSYRFICDKKYVLCETSYGSDFVSGVINENIIGLQFHPEKSHQNGVNIFKNFAELTYC